MRVSARAVAAAALLALAACGPGEKSKGPARAPPTPKTEAPALAAGEARVELRDGRVTVVCHDAPRGLVIEKLAREGSFQLAGDLDATPISLDLEAVSMDQVLPALLKGAAYRAQWRFDKDQDRHLLTRLELGEVTGAAQAGAQAQDRRSAARADPRDARQAAAEREAEGGSRGAPRGARAHAGRRARGAAQQQPRHAHGGRGRHRAGRAGAAEL